MTTPSAELLFIPKLDQAATRNVAKNSKEAISNATKQAGAESKANLDKSIFDGIKDGGRKGFGKLKEFGSTFAGEFGGKLSLTVVGIATAAAAVVADTVEKSLGGADEVADRLRERMNAQRQVELTGSAFGMSSGQYAAFVEGAQAMGLEMEDITGMMSGFSDSLANPEMARYKELVDNYGIDAGFIDLIQKAAAMDATKAQQFLSNAIGGEDAVKVNMFASKVREMDDKGLGVSLDSMASYITGRKIVSADITKDIDAQKPYRDRVYQHDSYLFDKHLRQQVSDQDVADINSRSDSRESVDDANTNAFHQKTLTANTLDSITVGQINAGKTTVKEITGFSDAMNKVVNEHFSNITKNTPNKDTSNKEEETSNPYSGMYEGPVRAQFIEDLVSAYKKAFEPVSESLGTKHSQESNRR